MKLFNSYRASWMPNKLPVSLPPPPKKDPSVAIGTPIVTLKISRKWWMSSEQRMQLKIPTIRGKLIPYHIYICLEYNKSNKEEILV